MAQSGSGFQPLRGGWKPPPLFGHSPQKYNFLRGQDISPFGLNDSIVCHSERMGGISLHVENQLMPLFFEQTHNIGQPSDVDRGRESGASAFTKMGLHRHEFILPGEAAHSDGRDKVSSQ